MIWYICHSVACRNDLLSSFRLVEIPSMFQSTFQCCIRSSDVSAHSPKVLKPQRQPSADARRLCRETTPVRKLNVQPNSVRQEVSGIPADLHRFAVSLAVGKDPAFEHQRDHHASGPHSGDGYVLALAWG